MWGGMGAPRPETALGTCLGFPFGGEVSAAIPRAAQPPFPWPLPVHLFLRVGGAPQFRAQTSWSSGLGIRSVLLSSFLQEEEMPILPEHTWALSLLGAVCGSCNLKREAWERLVPHPASHSCKSVGGLLETSSTLSFIFPFLFFLNTYIP